MDNLRLEIVQNNNVSLFGVHIGMEKDVALSVLKNYKTTIGGNVIGISYERYHVSFEFDEYGFINGIFCSICDNGDEAKLVDNFIKYHKKLFGSAFKMGHTDTKGDEIREYYSSWLLRVDLHINNNVQCLSGRNAGMIKIRFSLGRDWLDRPLTGKELAGSLYSTLWSNNSNTQKQGKVISFPKVRKHWFQIATLIVALAIGFLFVSNKRYEYFHKNAFFRVDNWTGKVYHYDAAKRDWIEVSW